MGLASSNTALQRNDQGITLAIDILRQRFGDRLSQSQVVREQHAHTLTWYPNQAPDAVIFAHSTEEVAEIIRVCSEHKVPVIPFGTGTSLEGHINAPVGGITVDLSAMNEIIEVNSEDLDCRVQPGVTRKQLNEYLRDSGLFFPIDPGADASIGGMTATRASGTNAVRYGTMRENVMAVTTVMADGSIIKTATRAKKSSAGYDLTRLLVGSEGTLGIITEITLRLYGIPEAISAAVCSFDNMEDACNTVILAIQTGIPVARVELVDELSVKAINSYSGLDLAERTMLFLEFHGTEGSVKEQAELFGDIATEFGGSAFSQATKTEDRNKLWQARHDAYWASIALRPGAKGVSTDVCVPISRLADCVRETKEDIDEYGLLAPIVGHVGDGNFHVLIMTDMDNPKEIEHAETFIDRLNWRAIEMGGTCTGEHGVGQGKIQYLEHEHGSGLSIMRTIKQALDPDNIMNPGKILASK